MKSNIAGSGFKLAVKARLLYAINRTNNSITIFTYNCMNNFTQQQQFRWNNSKNLEAAAAVSATVRNSFPCGNTTSDATRRPIRVQIPAAEISSLSKFTAWMHPQGNQWEGWARQNAESHRFFSSFFFFSNRGHNVERGIIATAALSGREVSREIDKNPPPPPPSAPAILTQKRLSRQLNSPLA